MRNILIQHKQFVLFIGLLSLFRVVYLNFIPLTPQEAYYWYYSLKPALSYFDHPPMAAYSIWLGTLLFGKTVFGVKIMAVVWSLLTNILIYLTVLRTKDELEFSQQKQIALFVVLLFNLTIFTHLYSIVIVPDSPLLFFWVLIIFLTREFLKNGRKVHLLLAGAALGFGMVSKYTALAVLPAIFLELLLNPQRRRIFLKPHPYLALLLTIIAFGPVILWNFSHDWVSFKFQFGQRTTSDIKPLQLKYFFQLIASQLFMLTPYIVVLFLLLAKKLLFGWPKFLSERFFLLTGVFIIGGFTLYSFTSLVKMNWLLPGYIGLIIVAGLVFYKERIFSGKWMKTGLLSSLALIVLSHLILLIPNIPLGDGNTWSGWDDAAKEISEIQTAYGAENDCFIFTNSYKEASLLRFYLPVEQEVYAQNIYDEPALQFDIWGIPDSLRGKNALYVFSDRRENPNNLDKLKNYFSNIKLIKKFEFRFTGNILTRTIYCYLCENYAGAN